MPKRSYSLALSEGHRETVKRWSKRYGISEGAVVRLLISKVLDGTCDSVTDTMECCRCQFVLGCETMAQAETNFEPELMKPAEVTDEGPVD